MSTMAKDDPITVEDQILFFRQIVDSSPALLHTARPDGYLDFFNQTWLDFAGMPLENLLGWGWTSCIHPEDVEALVQKMRESFANGEPFQETSRVRRADGAYRWMLHQKVPIFDEGRNIIKWCGSSIDIDDRKRAEEQLARTAQESQRNEFHLAEAQRLGHIGSWVFEPKGTFEYWSHELFRIYGLDPTRDAPTLHEYLACIHPHDREFMASLIRRMITEASGCDVTKRIVLPSGEVRDIRCVGAPVFENGTLNRIVGNAIDVTEREVLTGELERREAYLAEAQRLSHTGSFGWNPQTGEIVWSDETYRIFEYDHARKPTLDMLVQRLHPQDRALFQQVIDRASQTGTDFEHEYRLLFADGRVKHVRAISRASPDVSGDHEFIGAVTDITDRKTAEEKIRSNERELHTLVEAIPAFVGTARPDGSVDFISQSWLDYSGQTREEAMERGWMGRVHPDDLDRASANWRAALAAGNSLDQEGRLRNADGVYRWFLCRDIPLRDENGIVIKWYGILFDIDEIKNWEAKLRRVIDAIPTLAFCSFADGSKEFVNKRWLDYTGLSPEESHMWGWQAAFHPEDLPLVMKKWEEVLVSGKRGEIEARLRRSDGVYRWFLNRVEPFFDDTGKIIRWYGTSTDIDSLKQIEQTLQMREHELLGVIDTIPSMLWSTSPTGESTHLSQRFREYWGVSFEEIADRGWASLIHPDDREDTTKAFFRAIETGDSFNAIQRLRRADGKYRWHHSMGEPLRNPEGKIIQWYGLSIDIDEAKRAEDHLRDTRIRLAKASRLATVAELAGSIAHELNQPLMSILANAQAANRWLNADPSSVPEVNSSIERIIRDARAADETMQHVRALFKQESFDKKEVNIPHILREVVRVVQEDPKKRDVPIECHFEESLPAIHVDQIQIQQVFINLILNAIEALEDGKASPLVTIRASVIVAGRVLIQVIDNGPGVPDPERIFDAFMTTKEKGMGIGLAVSRTVVEAHGGQLWAENNKTGGATFNVALPLSHASRAQA
ncbi:MAG: PAS domain-containing protein [Terracidiphilus sp.]